MWGPRAEILLQNIITLPLVVLIGVFCVCLVIKTETTKQIAYAWWVPILLLIIPGMSASADVLIHRQYAVLQAIGEPSAPAVYRGSSLMVMLGHIMAVVPGLVAFVNAQVLVSTDYRSREEEAKKIEDVELQEKLVRYRVFYQAITVLAMLIAIVLWLIASQYQHHLV